MADSAFHVLSLCSGTAMLDEGVRIALPEARTVGYVEREAFAQGILLARMGDAALEPAPIWCGPLEDFPSREWRGAVDCITAGFPCQPWSAAGKQQGEADDRWLWPAIAGIIRAVEPPVVFLENVPGLVAGRGINRVFGDLAGLGFDAEWCSLSAADVGAAHLRKRVFILAVDARGGRRILRESSERCERLAHWRDAELEHADGDLGRGRSPESRSLANAEGERNGSGNLSVRDGAPNSEHANRNDALANTKGRRRGELVEERGSEGRAPARGTSADVLADADGRQREQLRGSISIEGGRLRGFDGGGVALAERGSERLEGERGGGTAAGSTRRSGGADIFAPGPGDPRWGDILAADPWLAPAIEPGVCGLADGDAVVVDEHRTDQLRAVGNGVVALQAGVAFAVLTRRLLT